MRLLLIMPLLVLLLVPPAMAALQGTDVPNDDGSGLEVSWEVPEGVNPVTVFVLYRRELPEGGEVEVGAVSVGDGHYVDKGVRTGVEFEYRLAGRDDAGEPVALLGGPFSTRAQWFNSAKMNIMLSVILFTLCVLLFIHKANRGESLYLRKIAGLDELDDAVGRATEMGRPVFHVPGIGSVSDVATLASLSIMRRVAKRVAEYNVPFVVPCTDPLVMTTAQEVVKTAYAEAGRPEMFNPDNVSYLTYDQFGYAAGVDGMMLRDKPGAVLLLGYFMAESLILAETGNAIGAIQIAGTDQTSQLPFFVAACDYTLIGEELYAASSYLSREPVFLGSLKGQDLMKVIILCLTGFGVILATLGAITGDGSFLGQASTAFSAVFETVGA